MLEQEIKNQLKSVFEVLENEITLSYFKTQHVKQDELIEMLEEVASTSQLLKVEEIDELRETPTFIIKYKNNANGVSFRGIPGGHEFSSLVLAILNSDGKGKMPDPGIVQRIKNLKGNISLKTYVSLSCENCPNVVQVLNLFTILNKNISHEMIDGEFALEETQSLSIQGVPAVFSKNELISSGKTELIEILKKLEDKFATVDKEKNELVELGEFDVVIIGGGPAGGASAIYSARKGLRTAIITDRVGGQVKDTKGIENLISVPYTEGAILSSQIEKHMQEYNISIFEHRKVAKIVNNNLKNIILEGNEIIKSKSVIIATGAKWRELGIEGEKEYIGRGVAFCPHCDGPYYKGKDIVVVGGGNSGVEAAIDLAGIVKSVTLLEFADEIRADKVLVDKLNSLKNTKIIMSARTSKIIGDGSKVVGLEFEDRRNQEIKKMDIDGIFIQIGLSPNSDFVKDLVEINRLGEIIIDEKCRTTVPGIFAAGDVTTVPYKQIIISMGEGAKAALTAFEDLSYK
ncbi:MAG: alkyl hydroperoxide reductase subunit F [Halobacteriovoraceae bacterium]|nr:alkyl hydroperoxide reductase subunit F [Halobacteriovoraceae bacterium]